MEIGMLRSILVAAALVIAASQGIAHAEDFYRGKTVRLIVPSAPGGGYDASGRTLAQHMAKHIPGEPTVIVQNMPGAGGLSAANWLFNVAPKDGLTFGLIQRGVPFYPFLGDKNALFVPTQFNWLGSITAEVGAITVFHTSKAKTMADTFAFPVVMGGSGPNDSETYVNLMNNTIGTKFKLVSGYKANSETLLAIERGEVEGLSGSWSSMKANRPKWVEDNQVRVLVQIGINPQTDLPGVPMIMDYVKDDESRAMWKVALAMAQVGRPVAAPPGIPAELASILRKAFWDTMQDPAFVADMENAGREVSPESGESMERILQEVAATPPSTLSKLVVYMQGSGK
jgi:tripartite-type tricarboxylate transporter receptor subunit TctC